MSKKCPNCNREGVSVFYKTAHIPVHSVLLLRTKAAAINFPKGSIHLAFCHHCSFISNTAFDGKLLNYSDHYESTQSYSPTFNKFHHRLATQLIQKYDLQQKTIIEIGCGQGEFLDLICTLGNNEGIGFDPALMDARILEKKKQITFIKDVYSKKYADQEADFICCKMTLEHIPNTYEFMSLIREAIDYQKDTLVFFQIPSMGRILEEVAFWDIYYEHCSYFTSISLIHLFQNTDFEVLETWTDYDDQYLMIAAKIVAKKHKKLNRKPLEQLNDTIIDFEKAVQKSITHWKNKLAGFIKNKQRVVLWGSGSKAVTFLNTLGLKKEIAYVIDINPYRQETFMAGTGQTIKAPSFLSTYQPDQVIIMNAIYESEIQKKLNELGCHAQLHCLQ